MKLTNPLSSRTPAAHRQSPQPNSDQVQRLYCQALFLGTAGFCLTGAKVATLQQSATRLLKYLSSKAFSEKILNDHLLDRFVCQLELDPTLSKSHPNYENFCSYDIIAA